MPKRRRLKPFCSALLPGDWLRVPPAPNTGEEIAEVIAQSLRLIYDEEDGFAPPPAEIGDLAHTFEAWGLARSEACRGGRHYALTAAGVRVLRTRRMA